jgi:RNA polymerase sigma-70 factor (ECF subfamily)
MVPAPSDREEEADSKKLLPAAERAFELGRAVWPKLALEFDAFNRYFARHAQAAVLPRDVHAADMYLACACGYGVEGALAAFERTVVGNMARAVASIDSSGAFIEEILQTTREQLFVRRDGAPGKIVDYAGRASLRSWLCAVAVRSAISRRRCKGEQPHKAFAANEDGRLARGGPEFEYLRGRYKGVFEEAVRSAIQQLPAKERMLLRLHLVDGMSIDKLGVVYRVGRSTAARWLASARRVLFERSRQELHARLRLTSTELDSLATEIRSQIEVSIVPLLADTKCEVG